MLGPQRYGQRHASALVSHASAVVSVATPFTLSTNLAHGLCDMLVYLDLVGNPRANVKCVAIRGTTVIGRSRQCSLRIASNAVSRRHCEIRLRADGAVVVDLGSANGTFLNTVRLPAGEERPLPAGAELSVGGLRFVVRYNAPTRQHEVGSTIEFRPREPVAAASTPHVGAASEETALGDIEETATQPAHRDVMAESPATIPGAFTATSLEQTPPRNPVADDHNQIADNQLDAAATNADDQPISTGGHPILDDEPYFSFAMDEDDGSVGEPAFDSDVAAGVEAAGAESAVVADDEQDVSWQFDSDDDEELAVAANEDDAATEQDSRLGDFLRQFGDG